MKIKYLILSITALLAASCSQWLDVYPKSEITAEKVFEDEDGYFSALAGLYVKMSDDELYGFDLTCGYMDIMGGAVYTGAGGYLTYYANTFYDNPVNGPAVAPLQLPAFNYTRGQIRTANTDKILTKWWTEMYSIVANANVLIERIKSEGDIEFEKGVPELILGEAMAMKALMHFDLVRIFQPPYLSEEQGKTAKRIPYMAHSVDDLAFIPSSTTDEILDQIDADLAHAASIMKDNDPISSSKTYYNAMFRANRQYKMNYYAVKALQARVFLYREKNKEAYDAAMEAIEGATAAGVHFITDTEIARKDSQGISVDRSCPMENVFAVLTDELSDNMADAIKSTGKRFGYYGRPANNKWLSANANLKPAGFFSADGDIRMSLWKKTTYPSGMIAKYVRESTVAADIALYPKQAVTIIKLGELYLIAAEAANEAVSQGEALRLLNFLQNARKGGVFTNSDKEAIKAEILLEYRREMLSDGQLFYAYKRRNEPKLTTLFQTPEYEYFFRMDDNRYTPDIPDSEYYGGRTY